MLKVDIEKENKRLQDKTPEEIIQWALALSENRILSTSFGVYSATLLQALTKWSPHMKVIWCDTGYNDHKTYRYAKNIIKDLSLNMHIYAPKQTRGFIDETLGLPTVDDPKHEEFTEIVKLEPFRRALAEHKPELWFTNIRVGQTAFRDSVNVLSYSSDGVLKVSPFYHWSDKQLDEYQEQHKLPKNKDYFDPVKALGSRECGIHTIS
jgi:phosphoadenosine phosphosulfate reductase